MATTAFASKPWSNFFNKMAAMTMISATPRAQAQKAADRAGGLSPECRTYIAALMERFIKKVKLCG